jgi:hypothetical protein
LLLLAALTSCATGPGLRTRMISYMGATEEQLVHALGVPDKQITVNGTTYVAYIRQQTQIQSGGFVGFGPWGPYGGGFGAVSLPSTVQVWTCETTFAVKNDHVADVTFKGNDCN